MHNSRCIESMHNPGNGGGATPVRPVGVVEFAPNSTYSPPYLKGGVRSVKSRNIDRGRVQYARVSCLTHPSHQTLILHGSQSPLRPK